VQTFAALPQLTVADARQLALNSFEASFVPQAQKDAWARDLDEVIRAAVG
jgi:adenine deaminase